MSLLYNATNTFMGLGYTDINIFYFLVSIAIIMAIVSRIEFNKPNNIPKVIFSLLSFTLLIGCLFMSANVATYVVQPQYTENTIYNDNITLSLNNTMTRMYNGSAIDVIPQNSTILSVIIIIMSIFSLINFVEILVSLFEVDKNKIEVKGL